jgi:hypothetical protein
VEKEEAVIPRQWHRKHVPTAMNQNVTIEELLEAIISMWNVPRLTQNCADCAGEGQQQFTRSTDKISSIQT